MGGGTYAFGGAPSKATVRRALIIHSVTRTPLRSAPRDRKRKRLQLQGTFDSTDGLISDLYQWYNSESTQDKEDDEAGSNS